MRGNFFPRLLLLPSIIQKKILKKISNLPLPCGPYCRRPYTAVKVLPFFYCLHYHGFLHCPIIHCLLGLVFHHPRCWPSLQPSTTCSWSRSPTIHRRSHSLAAFRRFHIWKSHREEEGDVLGIFGFLLSLVWYSFIHLVWSSISYLFGSKTGWFNIFFH